MLRPWRDNEELGMRNAEFGKREECRDGVQGEFL